MDLERFKEVIEAEDISALREDASFKEAVNEHCFDLGEPAIVVAARRGNVALVDALLEMGADIHGRSSYWGRTVGVLDICPEAMRSKLLERGALPQITTFVEGVEAGRVADVAALLKESSKLVELVDAPFFSFGAPAIIVARKNRELVDLLLAHGADITTRNFHGFDVLDGTPPEMARYLIARGAELTIHATAELGMEKELRELIAADPGCVRAKGGDGKTPLHVAASPEMIDLLLGHGADINARCDDHGSTPLQYHIAEEAKAKRLVERGAEVDLFTAAALGDLELVKAELERFPAGIHARSHQDGYDRVKPGTILNWRLGFKLSPHQVAKERGHEDVYQFLMECSPLNERFINACLCGEPAVARSLAHDHPDLVADLSERDRVRFVDAVWRGDLEPARLMLELGFDVNSRYDEGPATTAAALFGNAKMLRLLLDHEPDLSFRNEYGATALGVVAWASLNFANEAGDYAECAQMLLPAGMKIEKWMFRDSSPAVVKILRQASLREMTVEDLPAVSKLGIASKAIWGYDESAMKIFTEELTMTEAMFAELTAAWVATEDEDIVGFASLIKRSESTVELEHLFVAENRLRKGIGSALLAKAFSCARELGFEEFMLISDPHAVGFYQKHGATEIGQHQSQIPGRSIPIMSLAIPA